MTVISMATAAAPHTFCGISTTTSSSFTAQASSSLHIPTNRLFPKTFLRGLGSPGFVADPIFAYHVITKFRSLKPSGKPVKSVAFMAKKSMGDLKEADLKGKKVLVISRQFAVATNSTDFFLFVIVIMSTNPT